MLDFGGHLPAAAVPVRMPALLRWLGWLLKESEARWHVSGPQWAGVPMQELGRCVPLPFLHFLVQRPYLSCCCRVYRGHKQDVLDLCWSKTQVCIQCSTSHSFARAAIGM